MSANLQRSFGLLKGVVSTVPDFAVAGAFLTVWMSPYSFGETRARDFMFLMLIEFIVIHSTVVLGHVAFTSQTKGRKAAYFFGLVLFYSLFAGAFSLAMKSLWPLLSFLGLTLLKLPSLVLAQTPHERARTVLIQRWGQICAFYVLGAGLTTVLPIPRLGLTREVAAAMDLPGSGLWVEQPHRVIAFGFLYFGALGLKEVARAIRAKAKSGS